MIEQILNWLYPPACIACKVMLPVNMGNFYICDRCELLFERVPLPACKKCGGVLSEEDEKCASCFGKNFYFDSNTSTYVYDELMRDLLLDMKFKNKKRIATGLGMMWAKQVNMPEGEFMLTWLPMHPTKQKERGFNQAEIMAKEIAKHLKIPCENVLRRIVDTPPQSGLHPKQRQENVEGAFEVVLGIAVHKQVVVIDDIYTTGASMNECAKVLKESGAEFVYSKTLAVTVRKYK